MHTPLPLDQRGTTQQRLLDVLLHNPAGMAVEDLTGKLGISANAVRQHLAALERDHFVVRQSEPSTRGRPQYLYTLSSTGKEAFPRRYRELSESLITELASLLDGPEFLQAMRRMGRRAAVQMSPQKTLSIDEAAHLMQQIGYSASHREDTHGGEEIVAMNCVFHQLAEQHPAVCEFDLAFMQAATGQTPEHRECMLRDGSCCRFHFPEPKS